MVVIYYYILNLAPKFQKSKIKILWEKWELRSTQMLFSYDSQKQPDLEEEEEENLYSNGEELAQVCSEGHRSTLNLQSQQGGSICLLCFSNLISNPLSPTLHVSYALSQISKFLISSSHSHFLVSPLLKALSSFDDQPIANQLINLILNLSSSSSSFSAHFVATLSHHLASRALAWTRPHLFTVFSILCFLFLLHYLPSSTHWFII